MADRTTLALKACEGMTDEDLAQRGDKGFSKMIIRKRAYAAAARQLANQNEKLKAEMAKMAVKLKILTAQVETLESFEAPISDASKDAASSLLAGIASKKA